MKPLRLNPIFPRCRLGRLLATLVLFASTVPAAPPLRLGFLSESPQDEAALELAQAELMTHPGIQFVERQAIQHVLREWTEGATGDFWKTSMGIQLHATPDREEHFLFRLQGHSPGERPRTLAETRPPE